MSDDETSDEEGGGMSHLVDTSAAEADDLSSRAQFFRRRLIEEFRLDEMANRSGSVNDPRLTTDELFEDGGERPSDAMRTLMSKSPHQLVRFKIVKRAQDTPHTHEAQAMMLDKRLARVKHMTSVPVSVWAHHVAVSKWMNGVVFMFIVLNAIVQGVQTAVTREDNPDAYDWMESFDDITLVVFTIEILIKWIDNFRAFFYDGWNIFDLVVTLTSLVPRLISLFFESSSTDVSSISGIRLFRTLRILKMIARMSSLRVVISTVIEAFRSLTYILLLLGLISFIFGIFAINLFEPYTNSLDPTLKYKDKFSTLPKTFVTLFQLLTLDQWYDIHLDIRRVVQDWVVVAYMVLFCAIGSLVFRNVFVGVMVRKFDQMSTAMRRIVRREKAAEMRHQKLGELQKEIGRRGSGAGLSRYTTATTAQGLMRERTVESSANADASAAVNEHMDVDSWNQTVNKTLDALQEAEPVQYMWPRDVLYRYLRAMEALQNNLKEHRELQLLAADALHQAYDA